MVYPRFQLRREPGAEQALSPASLARECHIAQTRKPLKNARETALFGARVTARRGVARFVSCTHTLVRAPRTFSRAPLARALTRTRRGDIVLLSHKFPAFKTWRSHDPARSAIHFIHLVSDFTILIHVVSFMAAIPYRRTRLNRAGSPRLLLPRPPSSRRPPTRQTKAGTVDVREAIQRRVAAREP